MATGLKSRIIFRKQLSTANTNYWEGDYTLVLRAKSIPSPFGEKNMVDTSTLEDMIETQEPGRRSAASMEVQGAFEKSAKDNLVAIEDEAIDVMILYGTDGKGAEGIVAFKGSLSFAPDEATEDHLTGTATIAVSTVPTWIEDEYEVSAVDLDASTGYPTKITIAHA